jgi:hypothetical protein
VTIRNKSVKELKAEWEKKVPLDNRGFKNPFKSPRTAVTAEANAIYYRMLAKAWWDEVGWKRKYDKELMWYVCEGVYIAEICRQMFPKLEKSYCRHKVADIIRYYEKRWNIRK